MIWWLVAGAGLWYSPQFVTASGRRTRRFFTARLEALSFFSDVMRRHEHTSGSCTLVKALDRFVHRYKSGIA